MWAEKREILYGFFLRPTNRIHLIHWDIFLYHRRSFVGSSSSPQKEELKLFFFYLGGRIG
jgi:hypothetical protein